MPEPGVARSARMHRSLPSSSGSRSWDPNVASTANCASSARPISACGDGYQRRKPAGSLAIVPSACRRSVSVEYSTRSPSGASWRTNRLRRTTRRSPIWRSQSIESGRSRGGRPPGPMVSTISTPPGASRRRAASRARRASSGPARCAITPARMASPNRSRRRTVRTSACASSRRPASRAARSRSSAAIRASARATSAAEPSRPTSRRAPPSSSGPKSLPDPQPRSITAPRARRACSR